MAGNRGFLPSFGSERRGWTVLRTEYRRPRNRPSAEGCSPPAVGAVRHHPHFKRLLVLGSLVVKGIAPERLAYEAYGEFSPFADNGSEQGRLQNRKVVVAISRFAWVPASPAKPLTATSASAAPQSVDSENVRVVTLPGGGIRITTRQD